MSERGASLPTRAPQASESSSSPPRRARLVGYHSVAACPCSTRLNAAMSLSGMTVRDRTGGPRAEKWFRPSTRLLGLSRSLSIVASCFAPLFHRTCIAATSCGTRRITTPVGRRAIVRRALGRLAPGRGARCPSAFDLSNQAVALTERTLPARRVEYRATGLSRAALRASASRGPAGPSAAIFEPAGARSGREIVLEQCARRRLPSAALEWRASTAGLRSRRFPRGRAHRARIHPMARGASSSSPEHIEICIRSSHRRPGARKALHASLDVCASASHRTIGVALAQERPKIAARLRLRGSFARVVRQLGAVLRKLGPLAQGPAADRLTLCSSPSRPDRRLASSRRVRNWGCSRSEGPPRSPCSARRSSGQSKAELFATSAGRHRAIADRPARCSPPTKGTLYSTRSANPARDPAKSSTPPT